MANKLQTLPSRRRPKPIAKKPEKKQLAAIATLAQRYLDRHQPADYRIKVVPDSVVFRGESWLVAVEPDKIDAGYDFINRIAEAALELEDKEKMSLFLVPVIPPEDD